MQVYVFAVLGSLLPVLGWLWFFRRRDAYDPEPMGLIIRLFLIGAIPVAVLASIANVIGLALITGGEIEAPDAGSLLVLAVLIAPLTEETLKYLGAGIGANRHRAFDEPLDGIIYGVTVGLGFAFAETVFYLVDAFNGTSAFGDLDFCTAGVGCFATVAVLRGLGSAVLHALASGIAGFALSRKKEGAPLRVRIGWVALAMLVHGLWNWVAFLSLLLPIVVFVRLLRSQRRRSPHLVQALRGAEHRHHDPRIGYHTVPLPGHPVPGYPAPADVAPAHTDHPMHDPDNPYGPRRYRPR